MEELKAQLPPDVREVMKKYEDAGDYVNPEYVNAVDVFDKSYFAYFRMAEGGHVLPRTRKSTRLPNSEKRPKSQKVNR